MTEHLFTVDLIKNCIEEKVVVYDLPTPIDENFEKFLEVFGNLKYPLGEGFSFIKLDVPGELILTGNIGSKELRLTVKHKADRDVQSIFENGLNDYLMMRGEKYGK